MLRVPTALLAQHVMLAIRLSVKHNEQVILRISEKILGPEVACSTIGRTVCNGFDIVLAQQP